MPQRWQVHFADINDTSYEIILCLYIQFVNDSQIHLRYKEQATQDALLVSPWWHSSVHLLQGQCFSKSLDSTFRMKLRCARNFPQLTEQGGDLRLHHGERKAVQMDFLTNQIWSGTSQGQPPSGNAERRVLPPSWQTQKGPHTRKAERNESQSTGNIDNFPENVLQVSKSQQSAKSPVTIT